MGEESEKGSDRRRQWEHVCEMTHIDCRIFFCALPKIPKLEGVDDEGESERMQASRAAAMLVT